MSFVLSTLIAATSTTTSSSKTSRGFNSTSLLFLVVVLAAGYFLLIRPRQARARQAQVRGRQLGIGDEVQTVGGILGRVVGLDDQMVQVEVSPGVVMSFVRRAVNARPDGAPPTTSGGDRDRFGANPAGTESPGAASDAERRGLDRRGVDEDGIGRDFEEPDGGHDDEAPGASGDRDHPQRSAEGPAEER